jgi:hypothetical protein
VVSGSIVQSGSFTTTGTIIAQTINVQQVTSSIVYSSGSNIFGNLLGDSQTFTGSVLVTGSLTIAGASSATSYSGVTIYGSTVVCSAVGLFSGCVGIGTVSPGARLEVVATGENVLKLKNSGGQPSLVRFNDTSTTLDPYIGSYGNDLAFGTYGGGEKMRITSTGVACFLSTVCSPAFVGGTMSGTTIYGSTAVCSAVGLFSGCVGVGTSSPITRLQVIANTPTFLYSPGQLDVRTQENQAANKGAMISIGGNAIGNNTPYNFGIIGAYKTNSTSEDYSSYMIFGTSDVYSNVFERMRITTGGNVGIGTCSPSQKLEVVGGEIKAGRVDSSNEGGQLSFGRASDNATGYYIDVYGSTSTPDLRFVDVTNSAVRMTLTSGGTLQMAATTISNNNATFATGVNGGYKYFNGNLANGEKFGSQGGTFVQGFYFISWYSTSGRGYAIFATVSPSANAGTVIVSSGGWATVSATYNASSAISLAFDGSINGPTLSNNTGTTVTFYSYVFGGA